MIQRLEGSYIDAESNTVGEESE